MPVEWARSLRDQCQRTGVAFFMKQLSQANTRQFKEFDKFPADLQVRESHAATA
jgi:protein gp37